MEAAVWIIADDGQPAWLLERTRRAFPGACVRPLEALHAGCWVEPGAWKPGEAAFLPEADEPMVLVGATLEGHAPALEWREALQGNGGVFRAGDGLPRVRMLWLNEAAADGLQGATLNEIAEAALRRGWRVIRHSTLDVCFDPRPRLLQVITSLQRGGAERLVLDLHEELPRHRVSACLMTLGSPTRAPFPAPADVIQRRFPPDPVMRAGEIMRVAKRLGVDAVHAHLVDGETLAALDPKLPLMVTFHNQWQSWPEGIERLGERPDALLIGCSQVVTRQIEQSFPRHMARTIWNGIREVNSPPSGPEGPGSLVLVAIANPRPQKRLPLIIDVLAQLPGAVLKMAGEPSAIHPEAQEEVRRCREKIQAHGLDARVEWLGAVEDVAELLAGADVFVSTSAHEGLSLAQLEALAAGVPVVATDVGGAAEVAARHPGRMTLLPVDAQPKEFAAAIQALAGKRGDGVLAADFTTRVMADRHAWLLRSLITRPKRKAAGLLLITNNFSTGGAQSSARRLLLKLRDMGEKVHAVVLQESPDDPTPGRAFLLQAGIHVRALDPTEAARALMPLLDEIAVDPPEAVIFWNVIPEHKLLLADALHGTRVFDVSPGEMFFDSLARYFTLPRPGLPYADARSYGQRLTGVIVKHESEVALAQDTFQRPVDLIPNGVNLAGFRHESDDACGVIGTAARIHPHKRLEDLIEAFRIVHTHMPAARLRIAGGPDAGQEAYAETLRQITAGLPVEWCGEVTDVATFHDTLCAFAMISEPSGCPNASLEAMASGLPVIATTVGGAVQQIEDGVTGFLTPRRDVEAMATALLRLIEDDELRAKMRVVARERVKRCFSLELMAARYRSVCLGR
ncbi:MAG: glycosyltransferase family 4 protein [Prosthecobacter sp.]